MSSSDYQPDPHRLSEKVAHLFIDEVKKNESLDTLFLTSSSDWGVKRNLGRCGARFAPKALLNALKNLNHHFKNKKFLSKEVFIEQTNFDEAQKSSTQLIFESLQIKHKKLVHLGGGHDHAYCLLNALAKAGHKKIIVFNFDAHCDTRVSSHNHSGTPFRQFSQNFNGEFEIYQIGINDFANSDSTLSTLKKKHKMHIITLSEIKKQTHHFQTPLLLMQQLLTHKDKQDYRFVFSLDADTIDSSQMRAVSAVNHEGLPMTFIKDCLAYFLNEQEHPITGIYEYNPKYDDVSLSSGKTLVSLLYQIIRD